MQRSFRIAFAALTLVAGITLASAQAASTSARIRVVPASGPPGKLVTVRGSGFCAATKCGRVLIQFGSKVVARGIRVSTRGTFVRRRIQVPGGMVSGQVSVIASQRLANGRRRQTATLFELIVPGPLGPGIE